MFYREITTNKYGTHIFGWPKTIAGWCHKLKYGKQVDIRGYLLSHPSPQEGGGGTLRIPDHQGAMVYQLPQTSSHQRITGFATKWSQYCTGELKRQCIMDSRFRSTEGIGVPNSKREFSDSARSQGAEINIVQYLGIAADEPERIERHTKPGFALPLVEAGWDEAFCRKWCEENDLLSPIYTTEDRGGCWFCHNQRISSLRRLRANYPDLWAILMRWDLDSPTTFDAHGRTVHDFDKRFWAEERGLVPLDRTFRWKMLDEITQTEEPA